MFASTMMGVLRSNSAARVTDNSQDTGLFEPLLPPASESGGDTARQTRLYRLYQTHSQAISQPTYQWDQRPSVRATYLDKVKEKKRQYRWLQLDWRGNKSYFYADRRLLTQRKGLRLPVRDLRVLDPSFTASGGMALFLRERCIVVAMEHVRCLIMRDCTIVPVEAGPPATAAERRFLAALESQSRLYIHSEGFNGTSELARSSLVSTELTQPWSPHGEGSGQPPAHTSPSPESPDTVTTPIAQSRPTSSRGGATLRSTSSATDLVGEGASFPPTPAKLPPRQSMEGGSFRDAATGVTPFEHFMLDAVLQEINSTLREATDELVKTGYPVVEELTHNVTRETLLAVRGLKTKHQKLSARVTSIRNELEELTEDDKDLWKMCISMRHDLRESEMLFAQQSLTNTEGTMRGPVMQQVSSAELPHHFPASRTTYSTSRSFGALGATSPTEGSLNLDKGDGSDSHNEQINPQVVSAIVTADVEGAEALVESHFYEADAMHQKLIALGSYIQDAEEFVNINMDAVRNRLIKWEIVLTTAEFTVGIYAMVGSVLGENLTISPQWITKTQGGYIIVNVGMTIFCLLVFFLITVNARRRGLI